MACTANAQRYSDPADPRPDIFAHRFYQRWVPYRTIYHRPTFVGGYIAHLIEPSSQEAMSWEDNYRNGYYGTRKPTPIAMYCFPKPWEALDICPRRDPALVAKYRKEAANDTGDTQTDPSETPSLNLEGAQDSNDGSGASVRPAKPTSLFTVPR